MRRSRALLAAGLLTVVLACNGDESRVRQAMAVMASAPLDDEKAIEAHYAEARSEASMIDDEDLRLEVQAELRELLDHRKKPFEEAHRRERELPAGQRAGRETFPASKDSKER